MEMDWKASVYWATQHTTTRRNNGKIIDVSYHKERRGEMWSLETYMSFFWLNKHDEHHGGWSAWSSFFDWHWAKTMPAADSLPQYWNQLIVFDELEHETQLDWLWTKETWSLCQPSTLPVCCHSLDGSQLSYTVCISQTLFCFQAIKVYAKYRSLWATDIVC